MDTDKGCVRATKLEIVELSNFTLEVFKEQSLNAIVYRTGRVGWVQLLEVQAGPLSTSYR